LRKPSIAVAVLACLALPAPAAASHQPPPPLTDDPALAGMRSAPAAAPSPVTPPTAAARRRAAHRGAARRRAAGVRAPQRIDIGVVGALELAPAGAQAHGDVAAYRELAFVGKWRDACPGTGVDVISIAQPGSPAKLSDTADHPNTSMEDMQAMRINGRDVLATGLQDCRTAGQPAGATGLELHDVTDPAAPSVLAFFPTGPSGVHELDLTRTPGGRTLALLAIPDLELLTADEDLRGGRGDLLIVDVSDPASPTLVAEWGVLDSGRFGPEFYVDVTQGSDPRTYLHSVRANADGTRAYLSYWDAGVITLDISDPAAPKVLGRTGFRPGEEGNAHSVDEARGGDLLLQADEDFTAWAPSFRSNAFAGERAAAEATFGTPIASRPSRALAGEVAAVGRGCPAGAAAPEAPEDPYLVDPRGRVALLERGGCRFDLKAARAVQAGAIGVVFYNSAEGGEQLFLPGGASPVTLPSGAVVEIGVPVLSVQRSVGLALAAATPAATVRFSVEFNGWGYLRIWDNRDPANPVALSTFATPNTLSADVAAEAGSRWYTVHNPEVVGDRAYVSWYADGVRALDLTRPRAPVELGAWTGRGRPAGAPPVDIWSVVPHRGLLLASDRNYGLYVLATDAG
jgi:hypothetical protein